MLIEIRGVQFVNKGAYLMLVACQQQMARLWPNAQLVLAPNANSPYQARLKTGAWQKVSFRYRGLDFNALSYFIPRLLKRKLRHSFGLVFESDIDLVLDASGFSYGDQWGGRNVRVLAGEIMRLARHQAGYILLPQALGPFSQQADQRALRRALPQALLVCPRDAQSLQAVNQCLQGEQPPAETTANTAAPVRVSPCASVSSAAALPGQAPVYQHADFTNLVSAVAPTDAPDHYALIIPNSAMIGHRNKSVRWRERYVTVLQQFIAQARQLGLTPVILNHEGEADARLCQLLLEQQAQLHPTEPLRVVSPADPQLVKGWIKQARLVFCSRFHGCVSALSAAVPCVATSWSHKYEMLFAEYQQAFAVVDADCEPEALSQLCAELLSPANQQLLQQRALYWQGQSELLWQQVAAVVDDAICSGRIQLKPL